MVRVVDVMRGITTLPLIVHVPVNQPQAVADAIVDLSAVGCDAVIVGSPWPGVVMDVEKRKPALSGGVSGPAVRPLALRLVYEVSKLLGPEHIPVIAAGGIMSVEDVASFLAAGADAVMLESVVYVDPGGGGGDGRRTKAGVGDSRRCYKSAESTCLSLRLCAAWTPLVAEERLCALVGAVSNCHYVSTKPPGDSRRRLPAPYFLLPALFAVPRRFADK